MFLKKKLVIQDIKVFYIIFYEKNKFYYIIENIKYDMFFIMNIFLIDDAFLLFYVVLIFFHKTI